MSVGKIQVVCNDARGQQQLSINSRSPEPISTTDLVSMAAAKLQKPLLSSSGDTIEKIRRVKAVAAPANPPSLKLRFLIDEDYDRDGIIGILRDYDPAGLESRAKSMGIDLDLAHRIHDAKTPEDLAQVEHEVQTLVDERYRDKGAAIRDAQLEFPVLWKDLLGVYSAVATETFQAPWLHDQYDCVVSAFHPGLSSWDGNKVAIRYDQVPEIKQRILGHEILLSQCFQMMRKYHAADEIGDWRVWAFSEITAVFILDDPRLRPYWPDFPHAGEYFGKSNYPQLAPLEKQLKGLFDSRSSFKDYLDQAVVLLNKNM